MFLRFLKDNIFTLKRGQILTKILIMGKQAERISFIISSNSRTKIESKTQ